MNNNIVYKSFTIQIKYLHSWYSYIFIFLETGWFKKMNRKKIQGSRFLKKQKQKKQKRAATVALYCSISGLGGKTWELLYPKIYSTLHTAQRHGQLTAVLQGWLQAWHENSINEEELGRRLFQMEKCPAATDEEWRWKLISQTEDKKSCHKEWCHTGDYTGTGTGTACHAYIRLIIHGWHHFLECPGEFSFCVSFNHNENNWTQNEYVRIQ